MWTNANSRSVQESILITEEGNARVGDFGIRAITTVVSRGISTTSKPGVIRYLAPELLITQHSDPSKESDIYSFAMTAYEVFSSYYLVVCITNEHFPMTRSSRGYCRTV